MTLLAATDFSESANAAIRTAILEAQRRSQPLRLLHCIEDGAAAAETPLEAPNEGLAEAASRRLQETFESLAREGRPPEVEYSIFEGPPSEGIRKRAAADDVTLVAQGATGDGTLSQLLLGSTAEETVRASSAPVLTVPADGALESVDTVLAPVDLSECSRASLSTAADWARRHEATLVIQHSTVLPTGAQTLTEWEPDPEDRSQHREFRSEQLDDFLADFDLEGIDYEVTLDVGDPAARIVHAADERDVELVVMGTHGRRGFERFLLGSTATKVLRRIPCTTLTVRHRSTDDS